MRTAVLGACLAMLFAGEAHAGTRDGVTCDIQKGPCVLKMDSGLEIALSITPRPVKVMQDAEFVVTLQKKGQPVTGAHLLLDLAMPGMYMGNNQPKLKEDRPGTYHGSGIFPRCSSGRWTWKASLSVAHGDQVEKAAFIFEVL
jgi:hypothetical protein